ncbi:MAG: DUF1501 domain-containing protein [Myxococcota bacterium]
MSTFHERKRRREMTRRAFLGGSAALLGSAGLYYPQSAIAAGPERKFLFFWAGGAWDTTTVLDPTFLEDGFSATGGVDMDPGTSLAERGQLRWTTGPDRVPVDDFFNNWGAYAAVVNGVDAHSVGHDSGTQFMLTGTSASSYSDWPTTLAAKSRLEYPLPHVVFSGPSFPGTNGQAVVRAGGGTLLQLMDGTINRGRNGADFETPSIAPPADDLVDKFVFNRVADFASQQSGLARERADGLLSNIERGMELEGRQFEAGLDDLGNSMVDNAIKATELFRLGLSRTAMIRIPGGWDSHGNNTVQAPQQINFFAALNEVFEHLSTTPGHTTQWLINEVTIVAMSDFGRTPLLNGGGGKDHWPYASVLVAGAGVRGGKSYGYTDGGLVAEPIDFQTGDRSDAGQMLGCEHVGLALMKMGGIDPSAVLPGVDVLDAIVRG